MRVIDDLICFFKIFEVVNCLFVFILFRNIIFKIYQDNEIFMY